MTAQLDTTYVLVCDLEDLAVGTPALAQGLERLALEVDDGPAVGGPQGLA